MPTHKKKIDRDKYYTLAKEQGYRSRAAFKLIQINKKQDFLSKARVCLDLCAAPGGWCQVAAKCMPANSIVLGIDLLPIRPIRNVKTFVSDITTSECRALVKRELQAFKADVVLCDGAPNVGAAYAKDAFVQNELALAALKTATDHLGRGGTFCTKVYRSQDYNSLIWVFKQLFEDVQAIKPSSSRSQSAEIFVLCTKYKAPASLDPRLLDPAHVFRQIDGEAGGSAVLSIFHKSYDKQRRHRSGYNEDLGQTLRRVRCVSEFVECEDPGLFLGESNQIDFDEEKDRIFLEHSSTTPEIRECCKDLRVLNKSDFKNLLKWRLRLRAFAQELTEAARKAEKGEESDEGEELDEGKDGGEPLETEEDVQGEIQDLRLQLLAAKKREKKKARRLAAKLRERQALGMDHVSFEVEADDAIFSLDTIRTLKDLKRVSNVKLEKTSVDELPGGEDDGGRGMEGDGSDEDEEVDPQIIEDMLNASYARYLSRHKEITNTKTAKRAKKALARKAGELAAEDAEQYDGDQDTYVKMLTEDKDGDSSSSSEEEDAGGEGGNRGQRRRRGVLIREFAEAPEAPSARVARWFSDPIFSSVDLAGKQAAGAASGDGNPQAVEDEDDAMPKTDKEIRKERRRKERERRELKEKKKALKEQDQGLEFVPSSAGPLRGASGGAVPPAPADDDDLIDDLDGMDEEERERQKKRRKLIRAGMGATLAASGQDEDTGGFEIAPAAAMPPVMDAREYGSDQEEYDSDDQATTLALGTMMLRKSRAKKLVDASYNRYAWNDPDDLPEWFVDDEARHYRPQLPIPQALVDQIKERMQDLSAKPIKKVAEARARKRKRATAKLKAAKKKAEALANNPDMSEREKLRAVTKAMKTAGGGQFADKPSKTYVVARKFNGGKMPRGQKPAGGGKVKLVDKRMRSDKRGMDRAAANKGGGRKKGGGSKGKRR